MIAFLAPLGMVILLLIAPGSVSALDSGALPLRPGEVMPQPRQLGMNDIDELPAREIPCPACGFAVSVPEADKLMLRPAGQGASIPWRMHAGSRDADLCPYPWPEKIAFQADVVICPSCGFATEAADFAKPLAPATVAWVMDSLRPDIRAVQKSLLGARAAEMSGADIVAFFNHQSEIPDGVRLEHARIYSTASRRPKLTQAEATWLAAWAARREVASPPRGDFLARRSANVRTAMGKADTSKPGLDDDVKALQRLIGRSRSGQERLGTADRLAARVMLAGLKNRQGLRREAEKDLGDLQAFFRERFLRPDQDPLWSATSSRAGRDYRLSELESIRGEAEREAGIRRELLQREEEYLQKAVELIREAVMEGECDGNPDQARFHAYLAAEFLRRTGDLPLAAEWFRNLASLAPESAPLGQAAREQLRLLGEQAGDQVNLLSAMGRDGEVFEKLREICAGATASAK